MLTVLFTILVVNLLQLLNGNKLKSEIKKDLCKSVARKINHTLTLILLFISMHVMAQPGVAKIEKIGGKEFYIHYVKRGETLSKIAKTYKVALADVLNNNPGKEDRIDIGDKIKIPVTNRNRVNTNNSTNITNEVPVDLPEKKTIEHKVERGETIYGIARKYQVTPDDIYELNPDAKNGISPGTILKINFAKVGTVLNEPTPRIIEEKKLTFDHIVQPQETFFSISRKYNISTDSIKSLNNGLVDGLKAGSVIKLAAPPSKLELYKSWEKPYTAVTNATAGRDSTVVLQSVKDASVFKSGKKDVYEIGVLLPFNLDKNQKLWEDQNPLERTVMYEPTRQALDFYHGVLLAVDSLKKAGVSTNLKVFDVGTGKDSSLVKKIIAGDDFKKLDLVIGPFEWIEITAKAAKENKIPMMIPVPCSNKVLLDNPFAFKAITTSSVIADETSKYITKNYSNDHIILVDGKGKNDAGIQKAYKKSLNKYLMEKTGRTDSVKTMAIDFLSTKTIESILRSDKVNVLIIPSNDFAYISSTLSNLNKFLARSYHKNYKVVVFGTDEWAKYDQIDITHKLRSNVHIPAPTFVDFDTIHVHKTIRSFRNRFHTDPDKYALMGFDLAYYWLAGYATEGLDFANNVQNYDIKMNQTRFNFQKMNSSSGCLNKSVYILKYENYKLIPQPND